MPAQKRDNSSPKVVVKRVIHASRDQVFDAWTKPELMQHWFVGAKGTAKATVDLRVGGTYTNEMLIESGCSSSNSSNKPGEVKSYLHTGEYLEIVRPERLVFTWNSPGVQNTKVTVALREVQEGTEVTITHELPSIEDCPDHQNGWTFALSELASFLVGTLQK